MPRVGEMINPRPRAGVCRLYLRIGGTSYVLRRLDRSALAVLEGWRLIKPDGTAYDVARTEHGCTCDCPDYAWRRDGVEEDGCKHVVSLKAVGLLGGTS
jgi:hypothetical protein